MMRAGRDYGIKAIISRYENKPLGPVFLPPWIYDKAEAQGIDMRGYVRQEPIPMAAKSVNQNKPTLSLKR